MKRPTWVIVVGIFGIIMGCFGLLGAVQTMMMPTIMEFQKEIFTEVQKELEKQQDSPEEVFSMFNKMWNVPPWFDTWSIATGIIGMFVAGFYIFASIYLLQIKKSAVKLFYTAVGISIGFAILKGAVVISTMTFVVFSIMFFGFFGIVINIILLAVVATADKQAFISM